MTSGVADNYNISQEAVTSSYRASTWRWKHDTPEYRVMLLYVRIRQAMPMLHNCGLKTSPNILHQTTHQS